MASPVKLKLLRQTQDGPRGAVVDVSEHRAKQLVNHKPPLAVPVRAKMAPEAKNKMEGAPANKAARPLGRPPGGKTGEEKQSSSLLEAPAPRSKRWIKSRAKPAF